MIRRGWQIERPPLPEAKGRAPKTVALPPPQKREKHPKEPEGAPAMTPAIKVPKDFSRAHALVKQTRRAYTGDFYLHNGFVHPRAFEDVRLSLTISRDQVDRALLICDAVIKGAIEGGVKVSRRAHRW